MPTIRLSDAVSRIQHIVEERRDDNLPSPFFFIVGAGVSFPPVPLAREIELHCKKKAEKYGDAASPESTLAIDSYSHWFSKGYPSAESRQRYLRSLMEKLPISKANLRLAHLVLDGTLARTVFTPNFDDMLTRALELFGQRPLVCDHPLTVGRMRIESRDIQIIHVHGSYWFYDCCNLTQEIVDQSGNAPLSLMLDQSLRDHSPLVVGYSGWEGDILMASLKRRLSAGGLGTPIYWFCYRRESIETLPKWLSSHRDVYFVVPEQIARDVAASPEAQEPRATVTTSATSSRASVPARTDGTSEGGTPGLTAENVFAALVRQLDLPAPPLTENPLGFYADQLREFLGKSDAQENEQDTFYSFHTVIGRVERAAAAEAKKAPDKLQGVRDAMSKADYRGALGFASKIDAVTLSEDERRELLFASYDAAIGLDDNSLDELSGYDLVLRLGEGFSADTGDADSRMRACLGRALFNRGFCLGFMGRNEEANIAYDHLLQRFGDAPELALREQIAKGLANKGFILGVMNRNEEAIATYDDLLVRFNNSPESVLRQQVARALVNKGVSLGACDRLDEELAAYEELLRRFGNAPETALREQVAIALNNKGFSLASVNRSEEALVAYDELVRRFGDASESTFRDRVAQALVNKGVSLAALDRREEEIATYDDLLRRFGDATELGLKEGIARALVNKGVSLSALGRREEEIAAYDNLLKRFGDAPELALREQVAMALVNKGVSLGASESSEEEVAVYDEVLKRFGDAPEPVLREQVAMALANKALSLEVLHQTELAIQTADDILLRFADSSEQRATEAVTLARDLLERVKATQEPEPSV